MIRLLSISCFSRLARLPQFEKGRVNSNFDRCHFPGNLRWFGIDSYNWPCACVFVCVCVCACVFCVWLCVQNIQWPTRRFTGNTPTWQGAREQKNVAQLHCLIRIATVEFVSNFFYSCKYEGKPHAKVVVTCPNFCSTEGFPWSILSNIQVSRLDHNIPTWWGDPWAPFHFM